MKLYLCSARLLIHILYVSKGLIRMILFSVIIPHYNTPNSLKRLIQSIPQNENIQLIVVDDKSQEDVTEIENMVILRGGIFLHNTTDCKGAGICRNLGLAKAVGKWLIFADADDYFLNNAFHTFMKYADSDADIIYFTPTSMDAVTGKCAKRHILAEEQIDKYLKKPTERNEAELKYKLMAPWAKMIKRNLIVDYKIKFDEVIAANDVMFSVRCSYYAKTIEASQDKVYCVVKSDGTLTTKKDEAYYWARVEVFKDRYQFIHEHLEMPKYSYLGHAGLRVLRVAFRQGYSLKFILKIYRYFKKEHIKIVSLQGILYGACRHWI